MKAKQIETNAKHMSLFLQTRPLKTVPLTPTLGLKERSRRSESRGKVQQVPMLSFCQRPGPGPGPGSFTDNPEPSYGSSTEEASQAATCEELVGRLRGG